MKKLAEKEGVIEIMDTSWFCYNPIENNPCGKCNPCIYTIDEGLRYRFSKRALRRYRFEKLRKILKTTSLYRKLQGNI